jgi:integrase
MLDLGVMEGRRRRKTVYGQTEREVLQKLSALRTAHNRGIDLLAPSLTVGQWIDALLSDIKGFDGTRPRTLTLYKGLTERYVKPVIGNVRLDKLTPLTCSGSSPRPAPARHHAAPRRAPPSCGTCTS